MNRVSFKPYFPEVEASWDNRYIGSNVYEGFLVDFYFKDGSYYWAEESMRRTHHEWGPEEITERRGDHLRECLEELIGGRGNIYEQNLRLNVD